MVIMVDNLMNILKITEWFKWVNCIVCKLYLNNTVSEKEERENKRRIRGH